MSPLVFINDYNDNSEVYIYIASSVDYFLNFQTLSVLHYVYCQKNESSTIHIGLLTSFQIESTIILKVQINLTVANCIKYKFVLIMLTYPPLYCFLERFWTKPTISLRKQLLLLFFYQPHQSISNAINGVDY